MKKKKHAFFSFFIAGVLLIGSTSAAFADSKAELKKEYEFTVKNADHLEYDAPEKIKENGKTYKLLNIKYEIVEDNIVEITKRVKTSDKNDFPRTIKERVNGKILTLTAKTEAPQWKEVKADSVIKTQEYGSRAEIPQTIEETKIGSDGKQKAITLEFTGVENRFRTETFSAPAKFYSATKGGEKYSFNGKIVKVSGSSPTWNGYKDDVKDYLGVKGNSNYTIEGARWTSSSKPVGEQYVRTATYVGIKVVPLYVATFTESEATAKAYTADVTYAAIDPELEIKAKVIATYDRIIGMREIIMIGGGVAVLAIAAAAIIFFLHRRKRSNLRW